MSDPAKHPVTLECDDFARQLARHYGHADGAEEVVLSFVSSYILTRAHSPEGSADLELFRHLMSKAAGCAAQTIAILAAKGTAVPDMLPDWLQRGDDGPEAA